MQKLHVITIGIVLGAVFTTGFNVYNGMDYGEKRSFVKIKYVADCGRFGTQTKTVWYDADKRTIGRQLLGPDIFEQQLELQLASYSGVSPSEINCNVDWKQTEHYES